MIDVDDGDLMRIRADILYAYDSRRRMLHTNDPDAHPAPRLFLGCTSGGHVVRFGEAVPDELARRLETAVRSQPTPACDLP